MRAKTENFVPDVGAKNGTASWQNERSRPLRLEHMRPEAENMLHEEKEEATQTRYWQESWHQGDWRGPSRSKSSSRR